MTPTRSIGTSLLQTLRPPQPQAPPNMAGQGLRCQLRFLAREDAKAPRHAAQNGLLRLLGVTSVELTLFGRAGESSRRRGRVHCGGDAVEVTGTDLTLVLGRGVTALLGGDPRLLTF